MKNIELKEIQQLELEIMKDVHKFCKENNIRYYLAGGTLLGAIRHKGFIPWDDDIDIIMPRPDYERFIKEYKSKKPYYILTSTHNNSQHLYTFSKIFDNRTIKIEKEIEYSDGNIGGVEIDIFPMDGLPKDIKQSNKYFNNQKNIFKYYSLSVSKFTKSKNIFKTIPKYLVVRVCKFIGKEKFIKFINKKAEKYNFNDSEYVGCSVVPYYGNRERVLKSNYINKIEVQFESELFYAPEGYDEYLSNLYGDYMKLPPKEKRVTHHDCEVYWKDRI